MLEKHFRRPQVCERIRSNPIGELIVEFVEYLDQRGHAPLTIQLYAQAVEHFGRWLGQSGNLAISRESVEDFLANHFPCCCCPIPASRQSHATRAALRHLLRFRGSTGIEQAAAADPLTRLLTDYDEYLNRNAGLAAATRRYRLRYAQEFLRSVSSGPEVLVESLTPQHIMEFVTTAAQGRKRSSTKVATSSLRSFLRFLQFRGLCGEVLIRAVPSIPQWSLSGVPATMSKELVRSFLSSFDRTTATGRRDYAMALCMVEMGLRVSEVVQIEIADLDWRRAVLSLREPKGRRVRQLPLSNRTGQALAQYLKKGRPTSDWGNVFLRHSVPVGIPLTRELVRGVMRLAYVRCGFTDSTGTHVLRHTAATRVHQAGATLKEVADLLGHRSIETATIYTKVDLPELQAVALPWPEVQQ